MSTTRKRVLAGWVVVVGLGPVVGCGSGSPPTVLNDPDALQKEITRQQREREKSEGPPPKPDR